MSPLFFIAFTGRSCQHAVFAATCPSRFVRRSAGVACPMTCPALSIPSPLPVVLVLSCKLYFNYTVTT